MFRFLYFVMLAILFSPILAAEESPRDWGIVPIPFVGYTPDLGGIFGLAGILFYGPDVGIPEEEQQGIPNNRVVMNNIFTTNRSLIIAAVTVNYFDRDTWRLDSRSVYTRFPQEFFALGTPPGQGNEAKERFDATNIRLSGSIARRVTSGLYVGPFLEYVSYSVTDQAPGGALETADVAGNQGSTQAFLPGIKAIYDTTDGSFFPTYGSLVEVTVQTAPEQTSNTGAFGVMSVDLRRYMQPWAQRHDVLAVQTLYQQSWGNTPFFLLPFLGGDDTLRGFAEERFRGSTALSGQMEYRIPLRHRLGLAGFVAAGQAASTIGELDLSDPIIGGGVGLRFAVNPAQGLNLRLDLAFSREYPSRPAIYVNAREAF